MSLFFHSHNLNKILTCKTFWKTIKLKIDNFSSNDSLIYSTVHFLPVSICIYLKKKKWGFPFGFKATLNFPLFPASAKS